MSVKLPESGINFCITIIIIIHNNNISDLNVMTESEYTFVYTHTYVNIYMNILSQYSHSFVVVFKCVQIFM